MTNRRTARLLTALPLLALASASVFAPACAAPPTEPERSGSAALEPSIAEQRPGLLGINVGVSATDLADVTTLTARRARLEFRIANGESSSVPLENEAYWDAQRDATIASYKETLQRYAKVPGMRVMLTVDYESVPHYKDYLPTLADKELPTAAQTATFRKYVAQFVRHVNVIVEQLKDYVTVWEVWNEPDSNGAGPLTSKLFPLLLRDGTNAVRNHRAAGSKVITGVATTLYWQHIITDTPKVIDEEVTNLVDAINLHPYNNWPALRQPEGYADYRTESQNGQSLAEVLVDIDRLVPKDKPLVFSEFGDQTKRHDEDQQAAYLSAFYAFMAHPPAEVAPIAARVHEAYFFCLRDFGTVPMGLVAGTNPIGSPQPAHAKKAWTVFRDEAHASPP